MDKYSESVGLLLPTKGRYGILQDSLDSLVETIGAKKLLDVIIVVDQDLKSYVIANDFNKKESFRSYTVYYSHKRLYPVNGFIAAYNICTSRYFTFMNDENIYQPEWLLNAMTVFDDKFPDKIGLLSLFKKKKAGLGMTTQDFVNYNGEFYNPAYKLYYSDDELTIRAILLGRYAWSEQSGVFHDSSITKAVSAITWDDKIKMKKIDRGIFYKRSENNFGLKKDEIYPWEGFREINLPLKGRTNDSR